MKFVSVTAPVQLKPESPMQALLVAEAHLRSIGWLKENPSLSPLAIVSGKDSAHEVNAAWFLGKIKVKDLRPALKLRSGASQLEVMQVMPSTREITYQNSQGKLFRVGAEKFVQLANQQGYRKVWDLPSFLSTLKELLKPVLAAIPLMWVLKLVINAVRHKPVKFSVSLPKEATKLDTGKK
jgi:hypothetical protein